MRGTANEVAIGTRFDRWQVIGPSEANQGPGKQRRCEVQCDCGTRRKVFVFSLLGGESKSCGCIREEQIKVPLSQLRSGSAINRWTLVEVAPVDRHNQKQWKCRCECGTVRVVKQRYLRNGQSRSCGCLRNEEVSARNSLPHDTVSINDKFCKLNSYCRRIGREVSITKDEFTGLIQQHCHYCGVAPSQTRIKPTKYSLRMGREFKYHGLDRINSDLGYHSDNVVTCCAACNLMKRNMTYETFKAHIEKIHRHTLASL